MGGKCFKGDDAEESLSIPLLDAQRTTSGTQSPGLSREEAELAESVIRGQILEKQVSEEIMKLERVRKELTTVLDGNERAREHIREINAQIQQLEVQILTLRAEKEAFDLAKKRSEVAKSRNRGGEMRQAQEKLQGVYSQFIELQSEISKIKVAIAAKEQTLRDKETRPKVEIRSLNSMRRHYLRAMIYTMSHLVLLNKATAFQTLRHQGQFPSI